MAKGERNYEPYEDIKLDHYAWFDFYADKYLEGRISIEGLKASYALRSGIKLLEEVV